MAQVLAELPKSSDPNLLVGFNKADDAGVYKISDTLALVQTLDFFPPIVDDPYFFGQIAAANALSDVYAMGGRPITAMNIVGFPTAEMPPEILNEILRGGGDKVTEAGAVVVGGHSIKDKELKYGISVTGLVDPNRVFSNASAKPGDNLYLTKPLGTGIITTGIKQDKVDAGVIERVIAQMAQLNRAASEAMIAARANAATDITGFGLLGHVYEMAAGSGVSVTIQSESVPILAEALQLAKEGVVPGGTNANRDYLQDKCKFAESITLPMQEVLLDPQTSGGMLVAISEDNSERFEQELKKNNLPVHKIGTVEQSSDLSVSVI